MAIDRKFLRRQITPIIEVYWLAGGLRNYEGRPLSDEEFGECMTEFFPEIYREDPEMAQRIRAASRRKARELAPT